MKNDDKKEIVTEVDEFISKEKKTKKMSKKEEAIKKAKQKKSKTSTKVKEEKEVVEETKKIEVVGEKEVDLENDLLKLKEKKKDVINQDTVNAIEDMFDDDLYITRAFKPVKTKVKVQRGITKILGWSLFLFIIGLIAVFFIKSFIENKINSKPINLFKHTLKLSSDTIINYLENMDDSYGTTYEFSIDTNMNKYKILDGNKFGISLYNKDNYLMEYLYLDSGYGIYNVKDENEYFTKYSSSNKLVRVEETNSILRDILLIRNNKDDLIYLINENNNVFNKIVDEKYFESTKGTISINSEEVEVIESKFIIDEYVKRELIKDYISEISKNDELIEAFANVFEINKDNVVSVVEKKLNNIVSDNIVFNIYTDKKYNMIGFDMEVDGFTEAYIYKYDDKCDIQFNVFNYLDDLMNELELDVKNDTNLGFNVDKDDVTVAINKNIKSSVKLKEFSKNKIKIEYMAVNGKHFNINIDIKLNSMSLNLEDYNILSNASKIAKDRDGFYILLSETERELIDYLLNIYY